MGTIISNSPEETFELGRKVAASLRGGEVLALDGDFGAGKTQFVKGLAAGLGHDGEVTSPTFTLVHEYTGGRLPLFHFDLYRLEDAGEVMGLGFDDYLDSGGVLAVEWAGKFPEVHPRGTRRFAFRVCDGDEREIVEL